MTMHADFGQRIIILRDGNEMLRDELMGWGLAESRHGWGVGWGGLEQG